MVEILIGHLLVIVKPGPDPAGIIRGISYEPAVSPVGRRSGLTGSRHLTKIDQLMRRTLLIFDNAFHRAGQYLRRAFADHGPAPGVRIVQKNLSVAVHYLCIELGFYVMSHIGDRCIGTRKFQVRHTPRDPAQSQSLTDVRQYSRIGLQMIRKGRDAELLRIVIACLRTDLRQDLDRHHIDRPDDRISQGHLTLIISSGIVDRGPELIIVWFIDNRR